MCSRPQRARSFSFPEAERLVVVNGVTKSQPNMSVSFPDYLDWRAEQQVFVDLAARTPAGGVISGIGEPERVFGRYVTASFFSTLRVQPQIGPFFDEDEEKPGAARVIVIGDALWQRYFNADPAVIGRAINYNGASWTVIGVLSANFDFYGRSNGSNDVFLPVGQLPDQPLLHDRASHAFDVIARLRPRVSEREAATAMNTIAARLAAQYPVDKCRHNLSADQRHPRSNIYEWLCCKSDDELWPEIETTKSRERNQTEPL